MSKAPKISFASENYAGTHPEMMKALAEANTGHVGSYGNDPFTRDTADLLKTHFGDDIEVHFAFNGTGANNFGIGSITGKHHSVFCTDVAHLFVDESTAPEAFIGCRIYPVASKDGKMVPADLQTRLNRVGDIHHPQPKVVSITQPTEYGTVYTLEEIKAIKAICTEHNMLLHVDGARFFNAAVHLNVSLKETSAEAGVDVLTLGGTKIGMMFGEAVIFFNPASKGSNKFMLKRSMQLASKNRFIAAQFQKLLQGGLWQSLAAHTNGLAKRFEQEVSSIPSIKIAYPVETNAVFLNMSKQLYGKMKQHADFYYWNEEKEEARLVFSFANTVDEVVEFVGLLREAVGA